MNVPESIRRPTALAVGALLLSSGAMAQFTGPSPAAPTSTVAQAVKARVNTYVTLSGNVTSHLRGDYYMFRDASGEIRVEIEPEIWRGQKVSPETKVRIRAEVDRSAAGIYLWVASLETVN